MSFALGRPRRMPLEDFAAVCGLHPDLVRRLVGLGLLQPEAEVGGEIWFPPAQVTVAARIQRLRADLSLNYAAIGLVLDLLERIEELEAALRGRPGDW